MNGDQSLILGSIHLGQILCGHVNQIIQEIEEFLICCLHNLYQRDNMVVKKEQSLKFHKSPNTLFVIKVVVSK